MHQDAVTCGEAADVDETLPSRQPDDRQRRSLDVRERRWLTHQMHCRSRDDFGSADCGFLVSQ